MGLGLTGNDGYPAPYFDNVTVKIFPYIGPGMSSREIDLAQDDFPDTRYDRLRRPGFAQCPLRHGEEHSPAADLRNDPGDSMVVDIDPGACRSGL